MVFVTQTNWPLCLLAREMSLSLWLNLGASVGKYISNESAALCLAWAIWQIWCFPLSQKNAENSIALLNLGHAECKYLCWFHLGSIALTDWWLHFLAYKLGGICGAWCLWLPHHARISGLQPVIIFWWLYYSSYLRSKHDAFVFLKHAGLLKRDCSTSPLQNVSISKQWYCS